MPNKKKNEPEEEDLDEMEMEPTRAESKESKESKEEKKEKKKEEKWETITQLRIEVDFWKTGLHGKKIGIRQKDQQMAKSRQFSKDMNIYGEVKVGGETEGHIGFRTNEWETEDIEKGELARLVIRYFSESDRWKASIEQNNIKSIMLSMGYERGTPVFDLFHQGNKNVFSLEKIERGSGSMDRVMIPLILQTDSKTIDYFIIAEKRFSMGSDWKLYRANQEKKELASFDSKKFNIGGKVVIDVYDPALVKNKIFINTLILFGALIKFWDEVVEKLKDFSKKFRKDEIPFNPDRNELALMLNPRGKRA